MKRFILISFFSLFLIVIALTNTVFAKALSLNEISQAVCRVYSGGYGTGTCIAENENQYFVLTNAHVVGNQTNVSLEFFRSGRKTRKIPGQVVWRKHQPGYDVDFAIIAVDKGSFGRFPPRIIPLAPRGYVAQPNHYIAAVGCPNARWAQGWEGYILQKSNSRITFVPYPVGGQSGSGIMVLVKGKDGRWYTRIGAILTWQISDNVGKPNHGAAIPVNTLYNVMNNSHNAYQIPTSYQECRVGNPGSVDNRKQYAYGSNGKLYKVYRNSSGNPEVSFGQDRGVQILTWDYYRSRYCPPSSRWRPSPSPQPQPRNPYNQPPQNPYDGGGGDSPYDVDPPQIPDIGGDVPGEEKEKDEEKEKIDEKDKLQDKIDALQSAKEKMELELARVRQQEQEEQEEREKREKEEAEKENSQVEVDTDSRVGIIGWVRNKLGDMLTGLGLGVAIGLLYWAWNKFLKKRLVKRIDSLQDYLEDKIKQKWGPEMAKEGRELMEGVEEALLGFADDALEELQASRKVAMVNKKGKPAQKIKEEVKPKYEAAEILEAAIQAQRDATNEEEIPRKVAETLEKIRK